jgi:hypothetical protein
MENKKQERLHTLKALSVQIEDVQDARSIDSPHIAITRRLIALAVITSIFVFPFVLTLMGYPVTLGYTEVEQGFWPFISDSEHMSWKTVEGYVMTPLHSHMASAIAGFYFGTSIKK